jgi:hypothetical protein
MLEADLIGRTVILQAVVKVLGIVSMYWYKIIYWMSVRVHVYVHRSVFVKDWKIWKYQKLQSFIFMPFITFYE